jgi:hypothetical protein
VKINALVPDPLSSDGHKGGYIDVEEVLELVPAPAREMLLSIPIDGDLSADQESVRVPLIADGYVRSVTLIVGQGDEPTGSALLVDIRNTGNSIFATEENPAVPFINDGDFSSPSFGPRTADFTAGGYLTAVVTQIGSTTPGANLRAMVHVVLTGDETIVTPTAPEVPPNYTPYQRLIHDTAGCIAYWRFDEPIGSTVAVDDIGSYDGSYNGTLTLESTGLLTTEDDKAIVSATPGMWIDVPTLPVFAGNQPFSFEGWHKPSVADANFRRVIDQLDSPNSPNNGYSVINVSSVGFYFTRIIAGAQKFVSTSQVVASTAVHFVVTYDGATLKLYINGALVDTEPDARAMPAISPSFRFGHFQANGAASGAGLGTYDEFAVYNVALDAATAADHYIVGTGNQPPPPPPAAVPEAARVNRTKYSKVALYAPLNEATGTTVTAQKKRLVFFEKTGFVNGLLDDDAPLDPNVENYTGQLWAQAVSPGSTFNYYTFSKPVYLADQDVDYVPLIDTDGYMQQDNSQYKWGSGANVPWNEPWRSADAETSMATYKDRHLISVDTNNDKLFEIFGVRQWDTGPGTLPHRWPNPTASHGGVAPNLSSFSGAWPTPFGASGTSISILAGLVRFEEVVAGEIPHCIAFATSKGTPGFRSPATRGDQTATTGNRVQEGSIFRLPASFDVTAWATSVKASTLCELVVRAVQKYGMVCMDASGVVSFYGEDIRDPATGITNNTPWNPYFVSNAGKTNITGNAGTDVITASASHGITNGFGVFLYGLAGGAGLSEGTLYYAINCTSTTLQLAATVGGAAINFTTNITSGQIGRVQAGYQLFGPNTFPYGSLKLMPAYDAAATHRTPNTFNDLTGAHAGAVTVAQPSLTTNTVAKSASFAGGRTTFTDQPVFDVGATCTIRAITKTTTIAAGEAIILHRDVYELKRSGSSLIGSVTIGGVVKSVTAASVFAANTMADVALTYDGANVKLWKNGVQAGSSTAATGSVDASSDAITLGSLADTTKAFSGQLQHVEVLSEALPVARLLADYTAVTT